MLVKGVHPGIATAAAFGGGFLAGAVTGALATKFKINGLRVQHKLLHPGDEITLAKRHWTIQYTLQAGRRAMEELEEDIMSQSLLERAGLERPKPKPERRPSKGFDPADFLLDEDES